MGSNYTQTQEYSLRTIWLLQGFTTKRIAIASWPKNDGGLKMRRNSNHFHSEVCLLFCKSSQRFAIRGLSWIWYHESWVHSCTCIHLGDSMTSYVMCKWHHDWWCPLFIFSLVTGLNTHIESMMHKVVQCMRAWVQEQRGDLIASPSGLRKVTERTSTKS